jgi:hypothetical protein
MLDVIVALFQLALIVFLFLIAVLLCLAFLVIAPWIIGVATVNFFRGVRKPTLDEMISREPVWFDENSPRLLGEIYDKNDTTCPIYILEGGRIKT